jgi:predicted nucleic acid-binding protein
MQLLRSKGELYRRVPDHFEFPRDPADEPYLNLAIEAKADYVITRDKDLHDLMKWETEEGREFQKRFRFLRIVDPVAFLQRIDQVDSENPRAEDGLERTETCPLTDDRPV